MLCAIFFVFMLTFKVLLKILFASLVVILVHFVSIELKNRCKNLPYFRYYFSMSELTISSNSLVGSKRCK